MGQVLLDARRARWRRSLSGLLAVSVLGFVPASGYGADGGSPYDDAPDDTAPDDTAPDDTAPDRDEAPAEPEERPSGSDDDRDVPRAGDDDDGDPAGDEKPPARRKKRAEGDDDGAGEEDDRSPPAADDEEKKKNKRPPAARDDEPLRRMRSGRFVNVRARSVRLRESAYDRLLDIAKRYHAATRRKLVVTGGDRTPKRQAELMYRKLDNGEDLVRLYIQTALVIPIVDAFERGQANDDSRQRIIFRMTRIIAKQVKEGRYVSRHLAHTAADVRSRGLRDEHVEALIEAVDEVDGARLVDERDSEAPHFHLSL
ncbi:MAG: hypothetical protein AAF928_10470 [Myxococcota bacterium]